MEEIIQILIFVGAMVIAVIGQGAKNKKKSNTPSPEEVLEDMFPDVGLEQEKSMETPSSQPLRPKVKVTKQPFRQTNPSPRTVSSSTAPSIASKPKPKVRIGTKEEARRAFIHSEIFNRKY